MRSINADPEKKLILFTSEGKWSPDDPKIVQLITRFIKEGNLEHNCHLHVRPHFCWKEYLDPLFELQEKGLVSVDKEWNKSNIFPDNWDPSFKDMMHLANSIKYSDLVITSPSTIVLDASYFNKPIINIGFDMSNSEGNSSRLALLYETEYYKKVMEYDATEYVTNADQLLIKINKLLKDGSTKSLNQDKLKSEFICFIDGKSGERIAKKSLGLFIKF